MLSLIRPCRDIQASKKKKKKWQARENAEIPGKKQTRNSNKGTLLSSGRVSFLHSLAAVRQLFSLSNFLLSPFDSWRGLICHPAGDESDASHPDLYGAANEI